jgi:hypothetical protein
MRKVQFLKTAVQAATYDWTRGAPRPRFRSTMASCFFLHRPGPASKEYPRCGSVSIRALPGAVLKSNPCMCAQARHEENSPSSQPLFLLRQSRRLWNEKDTVLEDCSGSCNM